MPAIQKNKKRMFVQLVQSCAEWYFYITLSNSSPLVILALLYPPPSCNRASCVWSLMSHISYLLSPVSSLMISDLIWSDPSSLMSHVSFLISHLSSQAQWYQAQWFRQGSVAPSITEALWLPVVSKATIY